MTLRKGFSDRRAPRALAFMAMEEHHVKTSQTITEPELAKLLQAHFRRFIASARLTQDRRTGEPVVEVEFDERRRGR